MHECHQRAGQGHKLSNTLPLLRGGVLDEQVMLLQTLEPIVTVVPRIKAEAGTTPYAAAAALAFQVGAG